MKELELKKWRLTCHYPYVPILGKSVETGVQLRGIFEPLEVDVPCSIYEALEKKDIIKNVEEGINSLFAEWVRDRWWLYETDFTVLKSNDKKYSLDFMGVDYACDIYLNNNYVGYHEGELLPFSMEVSDYLLNGNNHLRVLVRNIPEGMGQIGCTELHEIQRHRFDYRWDFSCRLLNIGIFRPVILSYSGKHKLKSFNFNVIDACNGVASLETEISGEGKYFVNVRLYDGDNIIFDNTECGDNPFVTFEIKVKDVKLWFPNKEGSQNLYKLEISVLDEEGKLSNRKIQNVGFRTIQFLKNPGAPEGALPYTLVVNGKKIFIKGFSITPFDQQMGRINRTVYENYVRAAAEANANMIRVWGGGVIEQDEFYELCSRYGILVWQDFIQSSSGLSNVPCENANFLKALEQEVEYTVKTKRNFPATCIFCGGNEIFGKDGRPVTFDNSNIALIKKIVERYSNIYMLPSTSSGPTQEASLTTPSLNHDIHGPWVFLGNKGEYEHFNQLKCLFAGEFGVPGLASIEQICRITGEKDPVIKSMQDPVWRHHGDWWDIKGDVLDVFGYIPDTMQDYILLSSYIQVNALYYAVNSFRRSAPYQSGCLIWQLNEPFPNISCTSLIDFYGHKKHAYYAVKDAFEHTNISFKYGQLSYSEGDTIESEIYITCDDKNGEYDIDIHIESDGAEISSISKKTVVKGCLSALVQTVSLKIPEHSSGITIYVVLKDCQKNMKKLYGIFFPVKGGKKIVENIKKLYSALHY